MLILSPDRERYGNSTSQINGSFMRKSSLLSSVLLSLSSLWLFFSHYEETQRDGGGWTQIATDRLTGLKLGVNRYGVGKGLGLGINSGDCSEGLALMCD